MDSRGEADIFFDKSAKIVLTNSSDVTIWTLDNVEPLTSQTVTGKYNLVDNGSFELDGDGDNVPDNWNTTSSTSTATIEIDTTTVAHGTNSFKFASAGAGAGTATTADKFSVPDGSALGVSFYVSSNNTTATNKVDLIFYDSGGNNTSTTNVWTGSGTQPSSLTLKSFGVSVPAGKTQADVKLTGVSNAETATTYFDNVQVLSQSYLFTGSPGEVTADASELNITDGLTATTTELNIIDGVTATTADLNKTTSVIQGSLKGVVDATNGGNNDLTEVDFTGISSNAKRLTILFDSVSFDATSFHIDVRLGDSGGFESSGYTSGSTLAKSGGNPLFQSSSLAFRLNPLSNDRLCHGSFSLYLIDPSNNKWAASWILYAENSSGVISGGGIKSLSGTLDSVRIMESGGTNTFDSGNINLIVEEF